eukprot:1927000-Amphidinium_carterae.1
MGLHTLCQKRVDRKGKDIPLREQRHDSTPTQRQHVHCQSLRQVQSCIVATETLTMLQFQTK